MPMNCLIQYKGLCMVMLQYVLTFLHFCLCVFVFNVHEQNKHYITVLQMHPVLVNHCICLFAMSCSEENGTIIA